MRYSSTENIGLLKTGLAFEQCLGWICRTQPMSDVGIDMHVEEVVEGNPTARFLMVQVKSGHGNVRGTGSTYAYYMTQVHYKYYLHASFPVIFSLYLPDEDKVLWAPVEKSHVKRTESRWRLDIPKNSVLDASAERTLRKILDGYGRIANEFHFNPEESESIEALLEDWSLVRECTLNIRAITAIYSDCSARATDLNNRLRKYLDQGLDDTAVQVRTGIREYASILSALAAKTKVEMTLFSDNFAISYSAMISIAKIDSFRPFIQNNLLQIRKESHEMLNAIDVFVDALKGHIGTFGKTPTKYASLKISTRKAIHSTEDSIDELNAARAIIVDLIALIKD